MNAKDQAQVAEVKLKLAKIAERALLGTMGRPGDIPWWLVGTQIKIAPTGAYYIEAKIHNGLPMDGSGWPYGLPYTSNGIAVRVARQNPGGLPPRDLGPS